MVNIEKRYNAENTAKEEIEAIKERLSYYKDDIIIYKQLQLPTASHKKLFLRVNRNSEIGINFYF